MKYPKVDEFHGFRIGYFRDTLRERDVWYAKRHGVSMNSHTYDSLIDMIRTHDYYRNR